MTKIKTIKENIILENKFFKVENNEVLFNNIKKGEHLKITQKPVNRGIAVLPITSNMEIIIQDEYRYSIARNITQVVKGGVGNNETFEDAVRKELSEELNLEYKELIDLGSFNENPSIMCQENNAFLALGCTEKESDIENDGTEFFSNKRTIPLGDALSMCLNNELECSVTQMLILKASYIINKLI